MGSSNNKTIHITKASGEEEAFSIEKLEKSLFNAGAKKDTVLHIVRDIKNTIYPGVPTKEIYKRAFALLRNEKSGSSLRYRLKQAILDIGPTGYPFENIIGQLFEKQGYQTEVGIVVNGKCITHEMDVIATNATTQHLAECKYHKDQGTQVSIQVPLYVKSRVEDIVSTRRELPGFKDFSFYTWIVTNSRFSLDSIRYGMCSGLNLLAWSFPENNGLKDQLEKYKLYPVTILNNLNKSEKQILLKQNLVTCSQLYKNKEVLSEFSLSKTKLKGLMKELDRIGY